MARVYGAENKCGIPGVVIGLGGGIEKPVSSVASVTS